MVALLLLVSALAIPAINRDTLWFDEYYSIFESGGAQFGPLSPLDMWMRVASYSTWPPGYNTTLTIWSAFAGWSPFSGRLLSLLFGLLTLAVVFRSGVDLSHDRHGHITGLAGAAALAGSAFFVYYTHELRGYTFHLMLVSLSLWLYWRLATQTPFQPRRRDELLFVGALIMLLYSHPVGQVVFGALALYHLIVRFRQTGWRRGLGWFVLAGALYAPWIAVMVMRVYQELQAPRGLDPGLVLGSLATIFSNGLPVMICVPALGLLLGGRGRKAAYLVFVFVATLALSLLVNHLVPFLFNPRLLMALLPIAALLIGRGLAALPRPALLGAAFVSIWLALGVVQSLSSWDLIYTFPGAVRPISWPGFAAATDRLKQSASPVDVVLFQVTELDDEKWTTIVLDFYLEDAAWRYAQIGLGGRVPPGEEYARLVVDFVGDARRVWLVADPRIAHPSAALLQTLLARLGFSRCPVAIEQPDMRLSAFVRSVQPGGQPGACP